jgi:hypothetical protein
MVANKYLLLAAFIPLEAAYIFTVDAGIGRMSLDPASSIERRALFFLCASAFIACTFWIASEVCQRYLNKAVAATVGFVTIEYLTYFLMDLQNWIFWSGNDF